MFPEWLTFMNKSSKNLNIQIKNATQNYHGDLVRLCQELVKVKSVNGINDEKEIALLIKNRAKKLGLPSRLISLEPKRPNIFVGKDFNKKNGLLFVAHLDTVPPGGLKKWQYPPFGAKIKQGKLFGRGAIDCKAGIALSIYAMKILKDLGLAEVAKFAGVVDEEGGPDSKLGARYLLDKGLDARATIYTYPGVDTITIGHRGAIRLWVEFQGEAAHTGSRSWQDKTRGASAIEPLATFINRLQEIQLTEKHPAFPGYKFCHTATIIEGGSGESIVPERAKVLIDARPLPNQNSKGYIKKIKNLASSSCSPKTTFNITVKNDIPGAAISPKEPIVRILKRLDKEVMGIVPEVRGAGPVSEGYMFINTGIPTICGFGALGENFHAPNEYLELESLPKILEIYIRAALELSC